MNVFNLMRIINRKLPPYIWAWISKYKNYEEQTGSGTLVFENTYGQKFSKFVPEGQTEQESTEGYNLLAQNDVSYTFPSNASTRYIFGNFNAIAGTTYYISYNVETATSSNTRNTPYLVISGTSHYQYAGENANLTTGRKVWTFTPTENTTIDVGFWCNNPSNAVIISKFMVSTSSATLYEPYSGGIPGPNPSYPFPINNVTGENKIKVSNFDNTEEQTVTFPLSEGQYMAKGDYLADNGIHHVRNKRIYQSIVDGGYNSGNNWFYWNVSEAIGYSPYNKTILCNYLKYYDPTTFSSNNSLNGISISPAGTYVLLRNTNFTTAQEYKNWIASLYQTEKPFELEYDLATETIEPYTQAQQEAWNAIKELHTYLDYTQISQTNDGLPFILKVSVN